MNYLVIKIVVCYTSIDYFLSKTANNGASESSLLFKAPSTCRASNLNEMVTY